MWRISCVWLLVLGLPAVAIAQAAPIVPATGSAPAASPYSATVPVAGTSDAQRNAAIAAALAQVLQQTSPGFAPGAGTLANASGYVRNYRYQRAASGAGLELQVQFDPRAVSRLVAQGSGSSGGASATPAAAPTGAAAPTAKAAAAGSSTQSAAPAASAPAAASGTAMLWITGIDNAQAYASALALLRGDSQLTQVLPVGASNGGLLLQVAYSQPLAGVLAALEAPDGHLAAAPQPHAGADASLQWTP